MKVDSLFYLGLDRNHVTLILESVIYRANKSLKLASRWQYSIVSNKPVPYIYYNLLAIKTEQGDSKIIFGHNSIMY